MVFSCRVVEDPMEIYSINDRINLSYACKVIRKRINQRLMLHGVSMEDPATTYISPDAHIGRDTVIYPNTTIMGNTIIGEGNRIGPDVHINNCVIGHENCIMQAWLSDTMIGDNEVVGPFAKILGKEGK